MQHWQAALALNRFGYGAEPGGVHALANQGPQRWLKGQLSLPSSERYFSTFLTDSRESGLLSTDYMREDPTLPLSALYNIKTAQAIATRMVRPVAGAAQALLSSERPFHERLVRFWMTRFSVRASDPFLSPLILDFEREVIRRFGTGRYYDLLVAAARHPALLVITGNDQSIGRRSRAYHSFDDARMDETLARLLVDHLTLGPGNPLNPAARNSLARMLTGWSVNRSNPQGLIAFQFNPDIHEVGVKVFLNKRYPDAGALEGEAALWALSTHPDTAIHVSRQLAQHFVGPEPSPELIEAMEKAYLAHEGSIRHTLYALIDHPHTWGGLVSGGGLVEEGQPLSPDIIDQASSRIQWILKSPTDLVYSLTRGFGRTLETNQDIGDMLVQEIAQLEAPPFTATNSAAKENRESTALLNRQQNPWITPDFLRERLNWSRAVAYRYTRNDQIYYGSSVADAAYDLIGPRLPQSLYLRLASIPDGFSALIEFVLSPQFQYR